jgi:hypothetical protein
LAGGSGAKWLQSGPIDRLAGADRQTRAMTRRNDLPGSAEANHPAAAPHAAAEIIAAVVDLVVVRLVAAQATE